ncbi:hypothetical protein M413DRAFT_141508 [Hebeloma cylindrosporum]|uniref:Uncharacterized protein n=1 Tax=Hebeloma cylindrosporum TaxID=76867 RepID=A0A0C3BZE3_HEBCY|nr:hypothetical protein M413DRAFT_141508 [Hebeloma cylindrosporum h7]
MTMQAVKNVVGTDKITCRHLPWQKSADKHLVSWPCNLDSGWMRSSERLPPLKLTISSKINICHRYLLYLYARISPYGHLETTTVGRDVLAGTEGIQSCRPTSVDQLAYHHMKWPRRREVQALARIRSRVPPYFLNLSSTVAGDMAS